mmetsp:Transcript_160/g.513  ORF Transcript_160/g.513 Transcript_160/m.513 type:complete len:817 (+) Transcript_160:1-2451(+)
MQQPYGCIRRSGNSNSHQVMAILEQKQEVVKVPGPHLAVLGNDEASNMVRAGLQLTSQGRHEDALPHFQAAIKANPTLAFAHSVMGDAYAQSSKPNEAIDCYRRAFALEPSWSSVQIAIAQTLKLAQRHDEAIAESKAAVAKQPGNGRALEAWAQASTSVCEWDDRDQIFAALSDAISRELSSGMVPSNVHPWNAATYPFDADLVLRISRSHADNISKLAAKHSCPSLPHPLAAPLRPGERLRVAYVSSEFCDHPLGHLMNSVFGLHNRDRIEVFVYGLKRSDGSRWAKRIEETSEHFFDVSTWDTVSIAKHISDNRVHIAFNLNGWTKSHRNEVFALRPAPLQVQFLGFPATMGAPWIDYIVVDPVATPPEAEHCYSEALAMMPNSFICTDHKQAHMDLLDKPTPSRAELGLPETGMVYLCSNQLFKITPELFDVWCNILQRVPGSVIWLLKSPEVAEPRLKRRLQLRGVDPSRVIFTQRTPKTEYMRRMKAADLFLDTTIYNAFTTGCDAMWAGCPVLTLPLERLASRAAASTCCATGLGAEMVVGSLQEYEDRAVELGLNPQKLQSLKDRLSHARLTCPLYDTHTWVCDFENLLQAMWQRHASRLPPAKLQLPGAAPVLPGNRKVLPAYLPEPPAQMRVVQNPQATSSKFPVAPGVAASPAPVGGYAASTRQNTTLPPGQSLNAMQVQSAVTSSSFNPVQSQQISRSGVQYVTAPVARSVHSPATTVVQNGAVAELKAQPAVVRPAAPSRCVLPGRTAQIMTNFPADSQRPPVVMLPQTTAVQPTQLMTALPARATLSNCAVSTAGRTVVLKG